MKRKRCGHMSTDGLGILVKKAALKLDKTAAPILAPYDLTLTQYKIIKLLYDAEPGTIRQIDVERFCAMTNPTITGILQNLEKNQWILRTTNPQDARSKVISLTEKAYDRKPELYQVGDAMEAAFTQTLAGDEKEQLVRLLKRLLED